MNRCSEGFLKYCVIPSGSLIIEKSFVSQWHERVSKIGKFVMQNVTNM